MNRFLVAVLATLLLTGCAATNQTDPANWQLIHKEAGWVEFYFDRNSIQQDADNPNLKAVTTMAQGELVELRGGGVGSIMAVILFDCENQLEQEVRTGYFSRAMGKGQLLDEKVIDSIEMNPVKDPLTEWLFKEVCAMEVEKAAFP